MLSIKLLYKSQLLGKLLSGNWWREKQVTRAADDLSLEKDPLRAEYVQSIPEAQYFRNVLLQGYLVPASLLEGLEEMTIREDDVFVVTYPKSGTTWTEEIVSLIFNEGDVKKVENKLLIFRVHHLEVGRPFGQLLFFRRLKSPRLMATHLQLRLMPRQFRKAKCKVIYVIRNPKDTAVSYYHHHKMSAFLGNTKDSWDKFLQHFMAGHVVYGSWFDHVLPYWEFCKEYPNKVLFITFEELKLDLKGTVQRMCEFLERPLDEEAIDTIVKHCSFESMKENKMVNREALPISDIFDMSKSKFMRKGIIGDWKNHFTPEQSSAFDELCRERLQHSDLPITSDPEEAVRLMTQYGRIIHNHPERTAFEDSEEEEETRHNTIRHTQGFPPRNLWLPFMQLHLQPDPLTLDAL